MKQSATEPQRQPVVNNFPLSPPNVGSFSAARTPSPHAYFNRELINSHNVINSQRRTPQKPVEARKRGGKYKSRWERLEDKNGTKTRVCRLLSELGDYELANKFRACHSRFLATTCGEHITERKATFYCGHRACVFCAEIRARDKRDSYLPKVSAYSKANQNLTPCHLVLTQKHYQSEVLTDSIKRLLSNFRRLIRRGFWKTHLLSGGLYAVEFTLAEDGCWHAHLHCLVFRNRFFNVKSFRREWKEVTGDSVNFKIDRVSDIETGLVELVKYISKPLDADKFEARHLEQVLDLKAQRLFSSFGTFRSFAASFQPEETEKRTEGEGRHENGLCQHCTQPLFSLTLGIRELIELEKFVLAHRLKPPKILNRNSS